MVSPRMIKDATLVRQFLETLERPDFIQILPIVKKDTKLELSFSLKHSIE